MTGGVPNASWNVQLRETPAKLAETVSEGSGVAAVTDSPYATYAFLRGVIDADPSAIFVKDSDGRYVFVNQAVAEVFGRSASEIIGFTDAQLALHPDEAEAVRLVDRQVMSSGREV